MNILAGFNTVASLLNILLFTVFRSLQYANISTKASPLDYNKSGNYISTEVRPLLQNIFITDLMLLPVITPDTALSSLQSLNISVALSPLLTLNHTLAGNSLILVLANILAIEPFPRVRPPTDVSSVQFSNILVLLPVSCPKSSAMLTKDLQSQNILDASILGDICQSLGTVVIAVFSKALMALERLGQLSNSPSGIDVI